MTNDPQALAMGRAPLKDYELLQNEVGAFRDRLGEDFCPNP